MMHKLTRAAFAMFAIVLMSVAALAADPGTPIQDSSEVSDQKAGSLLVYNIYTSGATSGNAENTRINITNTSSSRKAQVHLFFVASNCQVADSYICLTPNQTASFLTSDLDPGVSGYIVAVASDNDGCPTIFNNLIGDEYVKFATGHAANLGAEAFAALATKTDQDGNTLNCGSTATLVFNGAFNIAQDDTTTTATYNRVPRVLAASSIPSRADSNDTLVIINRIGGNLLVGAATTGSLFGLLYDDAENVFSFSVAGACQVRNSLSNTFPRTTPRFESVIPAGRTGWFKVWAASNFGILGATINSNATANASASAFNGGRNMHKLTLTSDSYVIPIFPPSC